MKNLSALFLLLFIISNLSAQEIVWQKTIGGSGDDNLNHIARTSDGGFILGGNSDSNISGEKSENSNGGTDYWIVKVDSNGTIQWQNTIGGSDDDDLIWVEQSTDGGYFLGGTSVSNTSGDKSEDSYGGDDYWVLKTDSSGNILWQHTFGGSSFDIFHSIKATTDGGCIIGGASQSDTSAVKAEHNIGVSDFWVIKLNSSGTVEWENTIGGTGTDDLNSILQMPDNGYILAGRSSSPISADKSIDSIGSTDFWIVKTDSLGNIQWQSVYGGSDLESLHDIQKTSDGFIMDGITLSPASGNKTEGNFSGDDPWVLKIDSLGNIQWQDNIGATSGDFCESVAATTDGGCIVGCWANTGIAGDKTVPSNGNDDYWIIRYDANGNILWQKSIGGTGSDVLCTVLELGNGQYILAGSSGSNISGDKTEVSRGYSDYWIMKFTDTYNVIKGNCFVDSNANAVQDPGETNVINHVIHESNSNRLAITQNDGSYQLKTLSTGNYTVIPDSLSHYTVVPVQHSGTFTTYPQTDSLMDFAFQPNGSANDLYVSLVAINRFRPGFKGDYNIHYRNTGTTTLSTTITFIADSRTSYDSSMTTPVFSSADSVVWQVNSLPPLSAGDLSFTVNIDPSTTIIDTIHSSARIEPITGDADTSDNFSFNHQIVSGSFDPNEILVNRTKIYLDELPDPPYLEYTIFFQNTGNDTAFNVRINNPLPEEVDASTFELMEASHPVTVDYSNPDRTLWFNFENILLPDSVVNESMSHGYVKYRVKPKPTLVFFDHIVNQAFIYFDFNYSIATNTVSTLIALPTNINNLKDPVSMEIYPNPVNNDLNIAVDAYSGSEIFFEVFNCYGQKVKEFRKKKTDLNNRFIIGMENLSTGIYQLRYNIDGKSGAAKFLKVD
jgi:hypothetical protein